MKARSLRFWVMFLVSLTIILTFSCSLLISYHVTHKKLEENSLEMHEAYAKKFADTTEMIIETMQDHLKAKSAAMAHTGGDIQKMKSMVTSSNFDPFFNSIFYMDPTGIILATFPQMDVEGQKTRLSMMDLDLQKPFISMPYYAVTGRLIVSMSQPIVTAEGQFIGALAGTIYLESPNVLSDIVSEHFFMDQSYAWVVDKGGHLLYHPDSSRYGEDVRQNLIVQHLMKGETGHERVKNLKGIDMLVGYATVPSTGWGVGSQTPIAELDKPAMDVVKQMFIFTTPLILVILVLSYLLTDKLVMPLKRLASYSIHLTFDQRIDKSLLGKIPSWYIESDQLKKAVQLYTEHLEGEVDYFKKKSLTDGLTGLSNRRHIDKLLDEWGRMGKPFSLVLMDIDYFKTFNDTFGHQAGDEALKGMADIMMGEVRSSDICGRYGGEEFVILLPGTELHSAVSIVDRIHLKLSSTPLYQRQFITISVGVGKYPDYADDPRMLMTLTDEALYRAKRSGRNRTATV